ncbi:MAG: InlB B-repeat-containing protein, partial [Clostridiales bacterium]
YNDVYKGEGLRSEHKVPVPTKEGYEFKEFPNFTKDATYAEDTTYVATWTAKEYTITYMDGFGETLDAVTYKYGADIKAVKNPSKVGYSFKEWDKKTPKTMPAEDLTVTATWETNSYTITYMDGFGETLDAVTYKYGADIK